MCLVHSSFCIDLNLWGHDSAVHLQDVLMRYGWKHQRFTHNMSEIQRTRGDPDIQIHITADSWTDPQRKHHLWASECLLMCRRHLKHRLIRRKPWVDIFRGFHWFLSKRETPQCWINQTDITSETSKRSLQHKYLISLSVIRTINHLNESTVWTEWLSFHLKTLKDGILWNLRIYHASTFILINNSISGLIMLDICRGLCSHNSPTQSKKWIWSNLTVNISYDNMVD